MEYLNLHVGVLDSPELVGAEPVDRATWLYLMRYCAGQESGGRIVGCAAWGDRRWQQIARITLKEVRRKTDLWHWDGDDLVVEFYPREQESAVRAKRQAGRETAAKRWPQQGGCAPANASLATPKLHAEGKEKEMEGEGNAPSNPPPAKRKETEPEWLARMRDHYVGIDVDAELIKARRHKRKKGERLDRAYFELWLKGAGELVSDAEATVQEPHGWQAWLLASYPRCRFVVDGECVAKRFAELPASVQAEAIAKLKKGS